MPKLNVLVAGSTGYIGIQLIKLLLKHSKIKIKYLCGNSSVGKKISTYDKTLKSKKLPNIVKFNNNLLNGLILILKSSKKPIKNIKLHIKIYSYKILE